MPKSANIYYHAYERSKNAPKPTIVLIHGAGGNHLYWPAQIRRLLGFRVISLDLPGHGRSNGIGLQSIHAYAEAVLNWQKSIGLHSAVIVGHSMGSAIAITLALNHPEHVIGLALLGAGARLKVSPFLLDNAASPTTFDNAKSTIIELSFSPTTPVQLVQLASSRMADTRQTVLYGDLIACNEFDETNRLNEIIQPTILLCGSDDKMTPPRLSQFLKSNIPNADIEIFPNAGHMLMLEQPQAVSSSLTQFFNKIPF